MGNHRFRFSYMIPNSWFYKLKDMSNSSWKSRKAANATKKQTITTKTSSFPSVVVAAAAAAADHRKSYYFTRDLTPTIHTQHSPPLNTPLPNIRRHPKSSETVWTDSNSSDTELPGRESLTCSRKTNPSYDFDLDLDVYGKVDLPPIITKPAKREEFGGSGSPIPVRRRFAGGVKVKPNSYSPRINGNRVRVHGINSGGRSFGIRRRLSKRMMVVKTSVDPGKDFKESMVGMITENNIKSSKDLEQLLACYLSLNSDMYHDLIINVFKQIWFESSDIRF